MWRKRLNQKFEYLLKISEECVCVCSGMELNAEHSPLSHVGATGLSHSDRAGSPPAV